MDKAGKNEIKGYGRLVGKLVVNPAALSNGEKEKELETAQDIDILVKELPVTLGRAESSQGHLNINVTSAQNNTISRQHLLISYDGTSNRFTLKCLSKNGVDVDKTKYGQGEVVELKSKSAIRAGNSFMYWLPARLEKKIISYGPLIQEAIASDTEIGKSMRDPLKGCSVRLIKDWILQNKGDIFNDEKKVNNMGQGVYGTLNSKALSCPYGKLQFENNEVTYYLLNSLSSGSGNSSGQPLKKRPKTSKTLADDAVAPIPDS